VKRDCVFALYCERNLVERFFCRIKHFRAIATRYEKDGTKLPGRITSGLRAGVA
jgi:transposase